MKRMDGFVWVERIGVSIGSVLIVAAVFSSFLDDTATASVLWATGGLAVCVGARGFIRKRDPSRTARRKGVVSE